MPPLSIMLWLPAAGGLLAALTARLRGRRGDALPGQVALGVSLATLGLAIAYIVDYRPEAGLQHVTDVVWIAALGIHYKLAISGLNVALVGLTTLLFAAATLAANLRSWERPRLFFFNFMLAETAVLGAFLAQDLALF